GDEAETGKHRRRVRLHEHQRFLPRVQSDHEGHAHRVAADHPRAAARRARSGARAPSMTADVSDVLIVGAGPCGSLMARELARAGFSVVVLEAGRRYKASTDLRNSEANAGKIMWTEPRKFVGKDFVVPKAGM